MNERQLGFVRSGAIKMQDGMHVKEGPTIVKSAFQPLDRRGFIRSSAAVGLLAGLYRYIPVYAVEATGLKANSVRHAEATGIDLLIREETLQFGQRRGTAITINGTVPGPLVRLREGGDAILRVTNGLEEDTSIHWHGLLLPPGMDGVPGVSFAGIKAGETFTYRFPVRQNGTYWYHSHSAGQEQAGHYGPLIIDAAEPEPFQYEREHVVVLSDWTFENPTRVLARLKRRQNYWSTDFKINSNHRCGCPGNERRRGCGNTIAAGNRWKELARAGRRPAIWLPSRRPVRIPVEGGRRHDALGQRGLVRG